ncbi:MAG: PAS domain-containing protein [Nitrospira sp.]
MASVDCDERYRFVNAGYEQQFGLSRNQIVGLSVKDLLKDDYPTVQPFIRRVLNGERISFETTVPDERGRQSTCYRHTSRPEPRWLGSGILCPDHQYHGAQDAPNAR